MTHLAATCLTLVISLIDASLSLSYCIQDNESVPNLTAVELEGRPFLARSDEFIDVEVDSNLHLKCEGTEPIVWHSTDFDLYSKRAKEFVSFNESSIDGLFVSELTLEEITVDEIGYYSCHYQRTFDQNIIFQHNTSNSIYVFVTDPIRLFAGYHSPVPAINNSQVTGLCRPTSSFTNVTLWEINENKSIFNKFVLATVSPQTGIQFDPKIGYRITRLQKESVRCLAKLNNTFEEERLVSFHFQIGIDNYEPIIEDFNKMFAFIGDNLTLDCQIRKPISSDFMIDWVIGGQCEHRKPIIGGPADRPTMNKNFHILSKNLTLIDVQPSDQGAYKCSVHDWGTNFKEVTKYIKIFDAPKLELFFNYSPFETIEVNKEFILNVTIESVPSDIRALQLNWTKNGLLVQSHRNQRIKISTIGAEFAYLVINSTECDDAGLYILEANLLDKLTANVSLNLTLSGCGFDSYESLQQNEDKSDLIIIIVIFVIFGSVLLVIAVAIGQKIREARRQKREFDLLNYDLFEQGQLELINPDIPLDEQIDLLPYDNRYEFPLENLQFGQILGQGAFGRVIKAEAFGLQIHKNNTLQPPEITIVAVKTLKERADLSQRKALLAELKVLVHVGRHINIVSLLGAVTANLNKGELMIVVEYCKYGNVRSYLLNHRNSFVNLLDPNVKEVTEELPINEPKYANINESFANQYQNVVSMTEINEIRRNRITTCDLISYAFQCAKGMEYLSSKKLIHRDLAARNVLVADEDIVKICDFGLARDCYNYDNYVKKGEGPLPIKWMAIESMRDKLYTEKSDVWSFGVLLWELFTLGSNPYPGFDLDEEFYKKLIEGYRMERPQFAPNSIYALMRDCWQCEPNDRPNFTALAHRLQQLMAPNKLQKYEESLRVYSETSEQIKPIDEYMKMSESQSNETDSYVDMTAKSESDGRPVRPTPSVARPVKSQYDSLKNVRSIYVNTPVPKEPMELVPMIQL